MSRFLVFRKRTIFRLLAVLAAVGMGIAHVPIPMGRVIEKDRSQPFPCQDRPCGCRSASQCWQKCCCFTNAQKVAWAKTNQVTLPAAVIAAAEKETRGKCSSKRACCQTATANRSPVTGKAPTSGDFSSIGNARSIVHGPTNLSDLEAMQIGLASRQHQYVIGALAQQCQGQGSTWSLVPWCIVLNVEIPNLRQEVTGAADSIKSERCPAVFDRPPLPPPRRDA